MKSFALLVLVAFIGCCAATSDEDLWSNYKSWFSKRYTNDEDELAHKKAFMHNVEKIVMHNHLHSLGLRSHTVGLNNLTDLTHEEYMRKLLRPIEPTPTTRAQKLQHRYSLRAYPDSIDYRTLGDVTPVSNQGAMGSAVIFSSVGAVESNNAVVNGKLIQMSYNQINDCVKDAVMSAPGIFQYIMKAGGLDAAGSYPNNDEGSCQFNKSGIAASLSGYQRVEPDETQMMIWLATKGPVVVAVDASDIGFQTYNSGIYSSTACNGNNLDHSMLVVGYGVESNQAYWILKNSWGAGWGEGGYMRMARNANNMCGIVNEAYYPVVKKN